jgi:uncharacterized protein (DUF58 family)
MSAAGQRLRALLARAVPMAPTARGIALVAAGAPLALLVALVRPELWFVALLWAGGAMLLMLVDALQGPAPGRVRCTVDAPRAVGIGDPFTLSISVTTGGRGFPHGAAIALAVDERLAPSGRIDAPLHLRDDGSVGADIPVTADRRGLARVDAAWIGWRGPLGLARVQQHVLLDRTIAVAPSIRAAQDEGVRLFARDAQIGQRLTARLGEGSEFESLVRFMPGLDRRAIDWKQSARHTDLLAKQFEMERDNRIMLVIDAGRTMSDPMATRDGAVAPRVDRAVSAALALAYVGLRLEDRVSLSSIAARPRVSTREYQRLSDFAALRRAAADIDYAAEESNYTLGLASVGAALKRRSMIVLFTEFSDATSAELMLGAAQRLVGKHLLVIVVMADPELEHLAADVPDSAQAMAGATIAADLLRDRRVVVTRLRRMGAHVVEAPAEGLSASLIAAYVDIKRKGMI